MSYPPRLARLVDARRAIRRSRSVFLSYHYFYIFQVKDYTKYMKRLLGVLFFTFYFFHSAQFVFAKSSLSVSLSDITFSKEELLAGETVRIYARVLNSSAVDASGRVDFSAGGKQIGQAQSVSLRPNTYDDVFVDWKPQTTDTKLQIKITDADTAQQPVIIQKPVAVEADANHNGIADVKEVPVKPAQTSAPATSLSPDKYEAVYQQIQKGIENLGQLPPLQAIGNYINNASGGKAAQLLQGVAKHASTVAPADLNYTKTPQGFWSAAKQYVTDRAPYSYYIFGGIFLLILVLLFKKLRKR